MNGLTNRWIRRRIESSGVASRWSAADQLKRSAEMPTYLERHGPITDALRFQQACGIVELGVVILCIGLALLYAIGRSSPQRRRHGKYVVAWMVIGWIAAGLVGVSYLDGVRYYPNEADIGAAGFGMLAGWLVGMIHGGLVLWLRPVRNAEPSDAMDSRAASSVIDNPKAASH